MGKRGKKKPPKKGGNEGFMRWWQRHRYRMAGVVARVAIWFLVISVALLPSLHASNATISLSVEAMSRATQAAGFFRDFFYVTIVAALLAVTNMIDSLWRTKGRIGGFSGTCFVILGVYCLYILIYASSHFPAIAHQAGALTAAFGHDVNVIEHTLTAGIVTEIVIALRMPPTA